MADITVADDNLFAIAARMLGDATLWVYLADLNDLEDPFVEGVRVLKSPTPKGLQSGGVLS